jgi:hypothetical protein
VIPPRAKPWLRRFLLLLLGLLYALSIPWYRSGGEVAQSWLGLPDWVAVALLCYAGAAVLNAVAWSLTEVPDGEEQDEGSS